MAKTRGQKEQELADLHVKFAQSKSVVFARYMGLKVADLQQLRRQLRAEQSELVVSKKTLLGLMLEKGGLPKDAVDAMEAPAVVFGYKDEVAPAKVLADFAKKNEAVQLYGGVLEGKYILAEQVKALSVLPSRQELLAKMVGSMKSPVSGFVNVLSGNLRGLVQALNQIKEKKSA